MKGFPVTARIEVRWRDIDPLGHVNNAVYFTYFEVARARYFGEAFGARTVRDINFIVASIQCDFLSPVRYGDTVLVGIRIPVVGRTSFEFEYEAREATGDRPVARARSIQVLYDYEADRKVEITEAWMARVAAVEGQRPSSRPCRSRGG
jgi:acyl-CoA thioester hydrolase